MNITEKLLRQKQDFDDVYAAGKKAGTVNTNDYDVFWDNLQRNGARLHYAYAFAYEGWNDTIYNPKYPITVNNTNGIGNMFVWNQKITNTKVLISVTNGAMNSAFADTNIEKIPSLEVNGVTNFNKAFQNAKKLKELNLSGVIDINGFDIHWSTELTAESIDSIVRALTTTKTGLTITLPVGAYDKHAERYGTSVTEALWAEKRAYWSINELAV